jgi:hypothetical protein
MVREAYGSNSGRNCVKVELSFCRCVWPRQVQAFHEIQEFSNALTKMEKQAEKESRVNFCRCVWPRQVQAFQEIQAFTNDSNHRKNDTPNFCRCVWPHQVHASRHAVLRRTFSYGTSYLIGGSLQGFLLQRCHTEKDKKTQRKEERTAVSSRGRDTF